MNELCGNHFSLFTHHRVCETAESSLCGTLLDEDSSSELGLKGI